ncbi:unnamed protein product [Rangifer tarandus platyrhynchus]|uniref:Uncharacterized protein n=2 Tax=Rangifer tarandus platyrhynchus TaxID=3082113 RepID=A0ABN8Z5A1_RANTA|nr:unnamed protein product [Rangifer tarandus platyrhynchus]
MMPQEASAVCPRPNSFAFYFQPLHKGCSSKGKRVSYALIPRSLLDCLCLYKALAPERNTDSARHSRKQTVPTSGLLYPPVGSQAKNRSGFLSGRLQGRLWKVLAPSDLGDSLIYSAWKETLWLLTMSAPLWRCRILRIEENRLMPQEDLV